MTVQSNQLIIDRQKKQSNKRKIILTVDACEGNLATMKEMLDTFGFEG